MISKENLVAAMTICIDELSLADLPEDVAFGAVYGILYLSAELALQREVIEASGVDYDALKLSADDVVGAGRLN